MNAQPSPRRRPQLHRRDFLHVGSAGLLGLSLANGLRQEACADSEAVSPKVKNVIMIFLTGGPATIDMWDMKPAASESVRGEFQPRTTSVPGIQICEHLPNLASQMHRVSLVRSVTHSIPEHTQGAAYVMTGNRPSPAFEYPSLGSLSASLLKSNQGVPAYMSVGSPPSLGAGELGTSLNPFEFSMSDPQAGTAATSGIGLPAGFSVADLERRQRVLERIDRPMRAFDASPLPRQLGRFQGEALDVLRSDRINKALQLEDESDEQRKKYGGGFFGRSTLAARRLIEAGARFVTIGFGDWDTHLNNFTRLRTSLLPQLDLALGSLIDDLHDRGLLDETIVYCTGEFGRTPDVNAAAGRDHWSRTMTALLAGGGFRQGFVYGATDPSGSDPVESPCSPDDLGASIFHQLGFLPTQTVLTQSGRPVPLFRNGQALHELIG